MGLNNCSKDNNKGRKLKSKKEDIEAVLLLSEKGIDTTDISRICKMNRTLIGDIKNFGNHVKARDHDEIAAYLYGENKGKIARGYENWVMEHYGYEIPEEYLHDEEQESEQIGMQELTAIPQIDYSSFLTGIMTQLATLTSMPSTANDIGNVLLNISDAMTTIVKQLDKLQHTDEAVMANQNAMIQRMDQMQENIKYIVRQMKNK